MTKEEMARMAEEMDSERLVEELINLASIREREDTFSERWIRANDGVMAVRDELKKRLA